MNILFIYSQQKCVTSDKPLPGQEAIHFGISYISSVLKQNGHSTELVIIDRKFRNKNIRHINNSIQKFNPGLICFTSVYSEIEFITETAGRIRKHSPEIPLMLGGVHVTLNPTDDLLDIFDSICIGEGEYPLLEYVNCLETNADTTSIANLWVKKADTIHKNSTRDFNEDLDSLPFPDREMWQKWILEPQTRLTILLGRGCPYNCTYCCNQTLRKIAGGKYVRLRSVINIISELELLTDRFPLVAEYFFEVETIGCDLNWLEELCKGLSDFNSLRGSKLKFSTNLRIFPAMDFDVVFKNLSYAGFDSITIGLESGNDRIRREVLNRVYSNDNILRAVDSARTYGIKVGIFNMIGLPTETLADFNETLKMNQLIQPDWHSTSVFYPYKGTRLYEISREMNLLPYKLNTKDERQFAVLDLPGFSKSEIQKRFNSFHYDVYKVNENRKVIKLCIYFLMSYLGHNRFADLKISVIRVFYFLGLYSLARKVKLLGVFQKT